jgi:cytoskeletal protein CcmA (bactofilin family)
MQGNATPKTIIGEDVEITGAIKCASHIQIDGKLNGDLTCNGSAIVGTTAAVKGNLNVESITVLGQVNGNVVARDKIELKSSTRLNGDIKAKRLTVEDGVTFIGKAEVMPSGTASARTDTAEARPPALGAPAPRETADVDESTESKGKGGIFGRK